MLALALMLSGVFATARSATVTVTSNAPNSVQVAADNANAGDVIEIGAMTITLNEPITLEKNLTIRGTSGDRTTVVIDGQSSSQLFVVNAGVVAVIEHLTLRNGNSSEGGGGAILNHGTLTLTNCVLQDNTAIDAGGFGGAGGGFADGAGGAGGGNGGFGGAIFNDLNATLTLNGCLLANNSATGGDQGESAGSAIYNMDGGTVDTLGVTVGGSALFGSFGVAQPLELELGGEGASLVIADAFTTPGDNGPVGLDIDLINTTGDSVAGLQFDIVLSYVENATYGTTVASILNTAGNDLPVGFEVHASLLGPDTLRVIVFSPVGALLPTGGDSITIGQLRFTPAAQIGEPDYVYFGSSPKVSDADGALLPFGNQSGSITTVNTLDVTEDSEVDIRDVVVLVAEIVQRPGHVLPVKVYSRSFQVRDVNDDEALNVGDAIGIVNHILHLPINHGQGKVQAGAPVQVSLGALVALSDGQLAVPVMVNAGGIAGIQATFTFDPAKVTLGTPVAQSASQNLLIDSQISGSELKVVIISLGAQGLVTAGQPAFLIPVTLKDESAVLNLTEITVADRGANTLFVQPGVISQTLGKQGTVPRAFALNGNRPNPFNPSTEIAYEVPQQATIRLVVYNLLGQEVVTLVNEVQQAGQYTVTWNARNAQGQAVSSGVYLYRLISSTGFTQTKRMSLLK